MTVRTVVAGLADVRAQLRRALDAGLAALLNALTPRLRTALNIFEGASSLIRYDAAGDDPAGSSGSGSGGSGSGGDNAFLAEFLPVLGALLAPYQYALSPPLAVLFVSRVAAYVAKQLEPRIRRKRFSLLGALRYDADVRALAAFFEERSQRRVRARFARLLQMAQVLTCEAAEDALSLAAGAGDGDAGGAAAWELSIEETRALLALRNDL